MPVFRCYRADCTGEIKLTDRQHQEAVQNGTTVYCSYGHRQGFGETELQKVQRHLKKRDELITRLQKHLSDAHHDLEYHRGLYRCGFRGCDFTTRSKGVMSQHVRRVHFPELLEQHLAKFGDGKVVPIQEARARKEST